MLLGNEELVQKVLEDIDGSSLTDAEKLLMHFLDKVSHDSPRITPADVEPLHAAGWTEPPLCALCRMRRTRRTASGARPVPTRGNHRYTDRSSLTGLGAAPHGVSGQPGV